MDDYRLARGEWHGADGGAGPESASAKRASGVRRVSPAPSLVRPAPVRPFDDGGPLRNDGVTVHSNDPWSSGSLSIT